MSDLVQAELISRDAVHVTRAMKAGDEVIVAPEQKTSAGLGAAVGAAVGGIVTLGMLLLALLWSPPVAIGTIVLVVALGVAYGAFLGVVGTLVYDRGWQPASSLSALYRDFLVSVDVRNEGQLARVRYALAGRGGELVAA